MPTFRNLLISSYRKALVLVIQPVPFLTVPVVTFVPVLWRIIHMENGK